MGFCGFHLWRDYWGTTGLLSLPWRGRPKVNNNVFATFTMIIFLRPVLAEIPYWISASFQVKPWLFLTCAFKLLILALLVPQTGQQKGFSPVCILMCMISFCFEMNFLLHWSHWCSHESCLRGQNIWLVIWKCEVFTQDVFSHKGRAHYANDVPFHKCHSTTASSQCATS